MSIRDEHFECGSTHASLDLYHEALDPDAISTRLGIIGSRMFRKGDVNGVGMRLPKGLWSFSSADTVSSRDLRLHVDWILDQLQGRERDIADLLGEGYEVYLACYWVSKFGRGGPTLSPAQMRRLADLNVDIWFDLYCPSSPPN